MTTTEFVTSLSPEQLAVQLAIRDELLSANQERMSELSAIYRDKSTRDAASHDAAMGMLANERDAALSQVLTVQDALSAAVGERNVLAAHVADIVTKANEIFSDPNSSTAAKVENLADLWSFATADERTRKKAALAVELAAKQAEYDALK